MQAHWMRNNGCSDEEIADVIGEPWGEDEIDPDKNEYEERLENADTDEDLQELDIEKWLNMIEQAVKLDLLSKIKEEEFSVLIDIMLSYDIAPELEAKLKAEYRRRRKQNRNRR